MNTNKDFLFHLNSVCLPSALAFHPASEMSGQNSNNDSETTADNTNSADSDPNETPSAPLLPKRSDVPVEDTWDLTPLFKTDEAWETEFQAWQKQIPSFEKYRGQLAKIESLLEFLEKSSAFNLQAERIGVYCFLKGTEDTANQKYQEMVSRFSFVASQADQLLSFVRPELLEIPDDQLQTLINDERMDYWRKNLQRMLRYKPYTLSEPEERLIAMTSEMSQTSSNAFKLLTNADMRFGEIKDDQGVSRPLTHESFTMFLYNPDRNVRKTAFHQFYKTFQEHENTLSALYTGSVQSDIFRAKSRGFGSALEAALFGEYIPSIVYENLLKNIHGALPALHRYYDIRRRKMNLDDIHFYDTYVPILSDTEQNHTWEEAVELIVQALAPLGEEYCSVLKKGLLQDRWADRYENQNKQSGAFSSGSFSAPPYILINFKTNVLESVFTLAHEAGHSMHSYYSAKNQGFDYYDYTLFLAEIASTFNEEMLTHYLLQKTQSPRERAWLINREIDAIRGTIFRQTMFSEFEKITHETAEKGEPLSSQKFRTMYRALLEQYFGENFVLDDDLSLECLRIPHFYRAFYVYKYATGLSASIALTQRVLNGGEQERLDYFKMLKGGASEEPLEILRQAGLDMEKPDAIESAMKRFESLVDELDQLI